MCSLLIFTKPDNDHDNPRLDWKKFKAGDVIDISDVDKFNWGSDIQGPDALGLWSVVVVPKVQKAHLAHLMESGPMPFVTLAPQSPAEVQHQRRKWTVDTSRISARMALSDFLDVVTAKPDPINYNVIG